VAILASSETRILVQGITGREASTFVYESIIYGAKIVAGVTPGRSDQSVHGIPVFDTVAAALAEEPCDASIITVPPRNALDAAWEALDQGLKLLVVITERIPQRDVVGIIEKARDYDARIIGPNSLGIIVPGQTRIGMCGGAASDTRTAYNPGPVGIISRSGGMLTEIANMLTLEGIGQSTCVSIGGDPIIGTSFVDLIPLYEKDEETRALVLFCEPGGLMEEQLAAYLQKYPLRIPIIAFIAGRFTDLHQGMRFGHAGSIVMGDKGSPAKKTATLREAGVIMANKISDIPTLLRSTLDVNGNQKLIYSN